MASRGYFSRAFFLFGCLSFISIASAQITSNSDCEAIKNAMYNALSGNEIDFNNALRAADVLQECAPIHAETGRGMAAFYQRQYGIAVNHFKSAFDSIPPADRSKPGYEPVKKNLADAYFENGDTKNAIFYYNLMSGRGPLWSYKVAWAKLLDGDLEQADSLSAQVPDDFNEDGNLVGRPAMLSTAVLLLRTSASGTVTEQRGLFLRKAKERFTEGYERNPVVWKDVFTGGYPERSESFAFLKRLILAAGGYRSLLLTSEETGMWQTISIFAFGSIFVSVILLLAFLFPKPTNFQYTVSRIVLALACAGVATLLTGFLELEISDFVKAGGALAVFIVVYFKSPAALVVERQEDTNTG